MNFDLLHPRDQLVAMMTRLYETGMTTTSGGNLSIVDETGDMWITPSGVDKANLTAADIMCVHPDDSYDGMHTPSSEFPFHRAIYKARPDVSAIVHAHAPALVSFSIIRKMPDTRITPHMHLMVGDVGYAPYALPGSERLGERIAGTFAEGVNGVILENHGAVTADTTLQRAFQRIETLEYCARINIQASTLGDFHSLNDDQVSRFDQTRNKLPEFDPELRTTRERELRKEIVKIVRRGYDQHLMISAGGTVSARVGDDSFLITPTGFDRAFAQIEDIVLVQGGQRERGKIPSRAVLLHQRIYNDHPEIGSIITVQPPNATTYSVSTKRFDTKSIPESYVLLRDVPVVPYGVQFEHIDQVSGMLSEESPVVLLQNDSVLTTGSSVMEAFDRLEVAEFSAQSMISTLQIGEFVPMEAEAIQDLERKFFSSEKN